MGNSDNYRHPAMLIMGPPGSGKGTGGKRAAKQISAMHYVSTGDLCRGEVEREGAYAPEIAPVLARGGLVESDIMLSLFDGYRQRLKDSEAWSPQDYLCIDGMPRNHEQARLLEPVLSVDALLLFHAPRDVCAQRMLLRKRKDDTPETIVARLDEYDRQLPKMIAFYRDAGSLLIPIDATASPEHVQKSAYDAMQAVMDQNRSVRAPPGPSMRYDAAYG